MFVWCRGTVDFNALEPKLTSVITYTLWDACIERFLLERPIFNDRPSETSVNMLNVQHLAKWIALGSHISASLARYSLFPHCGYV